MDLIPSFAVDHTNLHPGIYISRKDQVGGEPVTTYDIRMTSPNQEPALAPAAIHTIEHLVATFLRNDPEWRDRIVYWGPMGCCTGNYLLLKGDLESRDIVPLMQEMFQWIADFDGEIPGANAHDCGNYMLNNLPMAKWEAKKYLVEVLERLSDENLIYPADED